MRLQYRTSDYMGLKTRIIIYEDGEIVKDYAVYDDEVNAECDRLEEQGYTFGYTEAQVRAARKGYEYKLARMISKHNNELREE